MSKIKKKLNVIRPTLRHKKLYLKIQYSKDVSLNLLNLVLKNFEKTNGTFSLIDANITLMDNNLNHKESVFRINKPYKDAFLSSLFFLKQDLGLIFILKQSSTINSLK